MIRFLFFVLLISSCYAKPPAVSAFERDVQAIWSRHEFQHPQTSAEILLATGKGDCQAWSNLLLKHARRFGSKIEFLNVQDGTDLHRMSLLYDGKYIWLQTNYYIERFRSEKEALEWSNDTSWAFKPSPFERSLSENYGHDWNIIGRWIP